MMFFAINKIGDYYYTKYINSDMDPASIILKFEIIDGTGAFSEIVGEKCTAAYCPIEGDKYFFKGKCDISDKKFQRMLSYKS